MDVDQEVARKKIAASRSKRRSRPVEHNRDMARLRVADRRLAPTDYLLASSPAVLFCIANLVGGAADPTAALWFTAGIALLLPVMAVLEGRQSELAMTWPGRKVLILFLAVLGVAAWTLIAPTSGGARAPSLGLASHNSISLDRSATLVEIIKLCGLAGIFLLGSFEGVQTRRATAVIRIILVVGAVWAVTGAALMMLGLQARQDARLTGGFMSANSGATVYGVLLVLAVAVLARAGRSLRMGLTLRRQAALGGAFFCVALFTGCLLATASRMGVVATALAVAVFLAWETLNRRERVSARTKILTVAGIVVALTVIAGADTLWSRLDTVDTDAANRGAIFAAHWSAFLEAPIFGHGLGSFTAINSQQMTPENYGALRSIRATHNVYIQWLEEAGILGALPMFALVAALIATAVRRSSHVGAGATLLRGLIAANLVVLVHGLTDYALQVPSIAAFWAYLLGLQFAYAKGGRTN